MLSEHVRRQIKASSQREQAIGKERERWAVGRIVNRWKPLLGALLVALVANLAGVLLFFKPIADGETTRLAVHPSVGLLVYVVLCLALFDWAAQRMGSPYRAAFVVAASQAILIVDLTLRGDRGPVTAAAGMALLAATWICVSYVYSHLGGLKRAGQNA